MIPALLLSIIRVSSRARMRAVICKARRIIAASACWMPESHHHRAGLSNFGRLLIAQTAADHFSLKSIFILRHFIFLAYVFVITNR